MNTRRNVIDEENKGLWISDVRDFLMLENKKFQIRYFFRIWFLCKIYYDREINETIRKNKTETAKRNRANHSI